MTIPEINVTTKSQNNHEWTELRIAAKNCNILVIVSKNGWFYNGDVVGKTSKTRWERDTTGLNVRFSMNGVWSGTTEEWLAIQQAIADRIAQITD